MSSPASALNFSPIATSSTTFPSSPPGQPILQPDLRVLTGAARTVENLGPVVLAEILDYDILTGLMPELRGRIPADSSEQVAALMASHGYVFFAVGERGILRVSTLRETVDGGSNYLFVKSASDRRFIPYTDAQAIRALAPR